MHSRVNTNETRRECQRRQAPGGPTENHSFTARKPIQRMNSRRSSYENKVEMQDITRKYKVVNCVDEKNLKWNTELIEAMELEHVVSQAAQNLNDGETRHGSREAQAHEHEYLPEREQVQWTKHANTSSSRTTRKHNCQTSRAEEVCLKNACMTDVLMTSPHGNHDHDYDNDHLHDTTKKVGALVAHHPG